MINIGIYLHLTAKTLLPKIIMIDWYQQIADDDRKMEVEA